VAFTEHGAIDDAEKENGNPDDTAFFGRKRDKYRW